MQRRAGESAIPDSELFETLAAARGAAATLVGAAPSDIVLCPNTSFGVNLAAFRLLAEPRSLGAIVVSDREFPANVYPWLALERHGFEVRRIPTLPNGWPDEEALVRALDGPDVRALALSSVQFATGYRADVSAFGRLCEERGILFVVDAIQELGSGPIDVKEAKIDILACGAQKWLCGPWGSGFAYVAPRHREAFDPPMVSWLGFADSGDFEDMLGYRYAFADSGQKFELATLGIQDYAAMEASINMFLATGPAVCRSYVLELQDRVIDWIDSRSDVVLTSPRADERRAGILMFRPADVQQTHTALTDAGIVCVVREGSIRIAAHVYNRPDEIDHLLEVLES